MHECKNATQPRFAEPKLRQRQRQVRACVRACVRALQFARTSPFWILNSRLVACIFTRTRNAKLGFGGPIGRRGVNEPFPSSRLAAPLARVDNDPKDGANLRNDLLPVSSPPYSPRSTFLCHSMSANSTFYTNSLPFHVPPFNPQSRF